MKRRIQIVVLVSVILSLSNCKKSDHDIIYSKQYLKEIKEVRKEIGLFMASSFVPGANIAISKNGELIYSEGIGLASRDLDCKAKRDTKFRIGSLSEIFTSTIYLKMVENGVLHPDSSIQHYYPEFPEKETTICLKHLANHVSGIREPYYQEKNGTGANVSLEKGVTQFMNDEVIATSGAYQAPSTFNYNLLGLAMQKAEKKRFAQLFESYLSDTLHLDNTVLDNPYLIIHNRSDFFDHNMVSQVVNANTFDLRKNAPSEGVLSTAEDLVKFGNAILKSEYFSDNTREKMFEKITLTNGVVPDMVNSWMIIQDRSGRFVYGKDGTVKGGSASLLIYPDEELVIAVATNLTGATGTFPIFQIAEHFLPKVESEETEEQK